MKKLFYMLLAMMMAIACQDIRVDSPVEYGQLSVALEGNSPVVDVETKATTLTAEEAADYLVSVYGDAGCTGTAVVGPLKYSEFGTRTLPLGTYYVMAESCTETEAESYGDNKGKLRYKGISAAVALTPSSLVQNAVVNCTVQNAKVTVAFGESVFDGEDCRLSDFKVSLSTTTKSYDVAASKTETEVYFNPGELEYVISGTFTQTGKNIATTPAKVTLEAKSNVKLNVKVNLDNGQIGSAPTITIEPLDENAQTTEDAEFNPYNN
ncbi:MAG: DUF4493 domain-containing protein [Candidatus Cryptobacteroides sp.]